MMKVSIYIAAIVIVVIEIMLLSTFWTFAPSVIQGSIGNAFNQVLTYAFFSALVTGVIILAAGIPVYFVLSYTGKLSQSNLALAGGLIPLMILSVIMFMTSYGGTGTYSSGQNYYGTYREMVVANERTLWGWVSIIEQYITVSVYGLIGAITFGKAVSVFKSRCENA